MKANSTNVGRLKSLGVSAPWQIPLVLPISYLDCRSIVTAFDPRRICLGQPALFQGQMADEPKTRFKKKKPSTTFALSDEHGYTIKFTLFGDQREVVEVIKSRLQGRCCVHGTPHLIGGRLYLNDAQLVHPLYAGRVMPEYPGKPKVISPVTTRNAVRAALTTQLDQCVANLRDHLMKLAPASADIRWLLECREWNLLEVIQMAHAPASPEDGHQACEVLDRIGALHLIAQLQIARQERETAAPARKPLDTTKWRSLVAGYGFRPTDEQVDGLERVAKALRSDKPTKFLVMGDVGTGKSVISLTGAAMVAQANGRAVVLLPNQALATDMSKEFSAWFPTIRHQLVVGDTDQGIDLTSIPVLIGTTALLFRQCGQFDLVITDEEQKLSVEQKTAMASPTSHQMVLSATPIPRTQALAAHGAIDTIMLTKCHAQKVIHSRIVRADGARSMSLAVMRMAQSGEGQILVVCPRKDDGGAEAADDDGDALPSVEDIASSWERYLPGRVRYAHSGMPPEHNNAALTDMKEGRADLLVSTTVVEVGITIPALRYVVVVHAERFGLTTLHQIRGRLVRKGGEGYFDLYLPKPVKEKSLARLQVLVDTCDGFEIAERDLLIRGMGDVTKMGERQHGASATVIPNRKLSPQLVTEMLGKLDQLEARQNGAERAAK